MRDVVALAMLALRIAGIVVIMYGALVVYGHAAEHDTPHCPTEDSCTVDYHDGAWHIREVTP